VLTRAGVILPNAPDAVRMANNKWETYCALTQASVSCARSFLVHTKEELAVLQSELLFPLVFKTVDGSRGDDVYFVHTDDSLVKTFELFHDQGQPVLVQHYIECGAADKRIIVVEGKVITAMTRRGQGGDFRSNLAQGGIAESTEISDGEAELALRVARALGLRFAGLDIATVEEVLPGREYLGLGQPFCLEANAMPALDMPLVYGGVDGSALLVDSMLHQHEHADSVFV
jgi:ribosomal protein S6--L-glutamate ligase